MFLRWVDGKAQVADAFLTKLHGDCDLLRAVYRQAFTVVGACDRIVDTCDMTTNRAVT